MGADITTLKLSKANIFFFENHTEFTWKLSQI